MPKSTPLSDKAPAFLRGISELPPKRSPVKETTTQDQNDVKEWLEGLDPVTDQEETISETSPESNELQEIYFDFDESRIKQSEFSKLENLADLLRENNQYDVLIEGHCDERGSVQYNLALGEKRAQSIKDYLVASGVEPSRITTISFGKERPVSLNHDEVAWSKNRRGNFVIIAK